MYLPRRQVLQYAGWLGLGLGISALNPRLVGAATPLPIG